MLANSCVRWVWLGCAAGFALLSCHLSGITIITDRRLASAGLVCLAALVGAVWCLRCPGIRAAAAPLEFLAQLIVMIVTTALLQYPAAQIARPLIDAQLAAIDRAVYFDWPDWFAWVVQHPTAVHVLSAVYLSLGIQSVLLCFLGWSQPRRVAVCLAANALTLTCCLTVFAVWPAGGAYAYYHPVGIGSSYVEQLMAARAGLITALTLDQVEGIIQFPSYHAAAAVLLANAFASLPRWIAVPGIIFETTLAVSAVPMGGHHLVDVLAGAAVGAVSLAIATRFATVRSSERRPLLRSAQPANSSSVLPI